jgi:hypothetical protein
VFLVEITSTITRCNGELDTRAPPRPFFQEKGRAMFNTSVRPASKIEKLLGDLALAACRLALEHDHKAAFVDAKLDLWHALRQKLRSLPASSTGPRATAEGALASAIKTR